MRPPRFRPARFTALICFVFLSAAAPCLWDYDTLKQERARFPTALELITGQFPRHSDSYYRWRIEDRSARMAAGEKTPEMFDDLAVAHSKLGDDKRAIEIMAEKEALHPRPLRDDRQPRHVPHPRRPTRKGCGLHRPGDPDQPGRALRPGRSTKSSWCAMCWRVAKRSKTKRYHCKASTSTGR